jgi:chromosome segregation ATPase
MCADYRAQRSELESILDTLKADVDRLKSEKEDARIELVSEKEAIAWWAHREEAASSNKVSSAGAIRDIRSKAETAGRAIRKAHVFEGKVKEAEVRYQALEVKHQENLEEERAVASGLRDRIGRLEGRLRVAEKAKTDSEAALEREKKERAEEAEGWKVKEETWVSEKRDLLQLRDDLKGKLESAEARVRAVPQEDPSEAVVAQQRA